MAGEQAADLPAGNNIQVMLAVERTKLAVKRTHLSWIRTMFTLMTSGIAIDKGLEFIHDRRLLKNATVLESGHIIGIFMTATGVLLLLFETIQFVKRNRYLAGMENSTFSVFSMYVILSAAVMFIGLTLIFLMLIS